MDNDIFGLLIKNPPYKMVGDYVVERVIENWIQTKTNLLYDKYFDYYECNREGNTWFYRKIKEEYKKDVVILENINLYYEMTLREMNAT